MTSSYQQALQTLQSIQSQDDLLESTASQLLKASLRDVAECLQSWGRLLRNVHEVPCYEAVYKIAENLTLLEETLDDLEHWLTSQTGMWCIDLLNRLQTARLHVRNANTLAYVSTFLQHLTAQQENMVGISILEVECARQEAAKGLLEYSDALFATAQDVL